MSVRGNCWRLVNLCEKRSAVVFLEKKIGVFCLVFQKIWLILHENINTRTRMNPLKQKCRCADIRVLNPQSLPKFSDSTQVYGLKSPSVPLFDFYLFGLPSGISTTGKGGLFFIPGSAGKRITKI